MFLGGPLFSIGLFWFGWSSVRSPSLFANREKNANASQDQDTHWIVPALSGLATGFSIFFTFQGCLTYLGDCYMRPSPSHPRPRVQLTARADYAASAFAAAQVVRSLAGFGFPLFAGPMIEQLGVPWTASLLGFVGLLLSPVPFVFYKCVVSRFFVGGGADCTQVREEDSGGE